jgi:transcriptional regulator with XRE-family HTH domain
MPSLRRLRELRRLTQDELSVRSGLQQTTISQLERGKVPDPRLSTLTRLSTGLRSSLPAVVSALKASVAGGT